MSGYAWSDNIGWISFNCTNPGNNCATSNYGVHKDATTGNLTGYAWSDNIGWIQFGGLSTFPTGPGTTAQNSQVVGTNLIGWARAVAGVGRTDGWDGWIALSGTGYGVTLNTTTNAFSNFAWGSDVVGWVSFSGNGYGVIIGAAPLTMSGTLTPATSSCIIASGASTCNINFSWTTTNPVATSSVTKPTNITVGTGNTGTNVPFSIKWGGETFYLYNNATLLAQSTIASTSVTCVGGTSWDGTKCAVAAASFFVTLSATPNPVTLLTGSTTGSTTLTWVTSPSPNVPTSCTATASPTNFAWSGAKAIAGGSQSITGLRAGTYNFTITCSKTTVIGTSATTITTPPSTVTVVVGPAVVSVAGRCSDPMKHYKCLVGGIETDTGTNRKSSSTRATWDCLGSGTGATAQCSEKKTPEYKEN